MNKTMQIFTFRSDDENVFEPTAHVSYEVRTIRDGEQIFFVAKDVCDVLELTDVNKSVEILDDDEKLIRKIFASGQNRDMIVITESGLYTLIMRSNKPNAKRFRKWVTAEVLPSIRLTGGYINPAFDVRKSERERVKADRKATKALCEEMSKHLKTGDLRMVGRQCLVDEYDVSRVLRGDSEDVSVMTAAYARATGNKINKKMFYKREGAEHLLQVLQNAEGYYGNAKNK